MKPGVAPRLDVLVEFLKPTKAKNGLGEKIASGWEVAAKSRAQVVPVSDGERLRAAAVEQKTDARFTVRNLKNLSMVDGSYRLRFEGDDWQITGIKRLSRDWLEITAWMIRKPIN